MSKKIQNWLFEIILKKIKKYKSNTCFLKDFKIFGEVISKIYFPGFFKVLFCKSGSRI